MAIMRQGGGETAGAGETLAELVLEETGGNGEKPEPTEAA